MILLLWGFSDVGMALYTVMVALLALAAFGLVWRARCEETRAAASDVVPRLRSDIYSASIVAGQDHGGNYPVDGTDGMFCGRPRNMPFSLRRCMWRWH